MGDALMGRFSSVRIGATTVLNIGSWNLSIDVDELDASVFGTGWGATRPGQQKWTATIEGFHDMTDTTGQVALRNARNNGTKITDLRFYVDSTSYYRPDITADSSAGAYVLSMNISAANNELVKISFKVGGVGPISLV